MRDHKDRLAITVFTTVIRGRNFNFEVLRVTCFGKGLFPLKRRFWTDQKSKPDKHANDKSHRRYCYQCNPALIGSENLHDYHLTPMTHRSASVVGNGFVDDKSQFRSKPLNEREMA